MEITSPRHQTTAAAASGTQADYGSHWNLPAMATSATRTLSSWSSMAKEAVDSSIADFATDSTRGRSGKRLKGNGENIDPNVVLVDDGREDVSKFTQDMISAAMTAMARVTDKRMDGQDEKIQKVKAEAKTAMTEVKNASEKFGAEFTAIRAEMKSDQDSMVQHLQMQHARIEELQKQMHQQAAETEENRKRQAGTSDELCRQVEKAEVQSKRSGS